MRKKEILWLYVFLFAALADISMIINSEINYRYFTKPLIMFALMMYFLQSTRLIKGSLLRTAVSAALFCSFLGDVLLLNNNLFLFGLGAFFITHVGYIIAFKLTQNHSFNHLEVNFIKMFIYNLPLYIVATLIYFLIHSQLNELKIPVIIYIMAIVMMVTMARERYGRTNKTSFWQLFIGAILFFTSDSLLALDRFFYPIVDGDLLIMGTYILGQLLIVMGIRSHLLQVKSPQ